MGRKGRQGRGIDTRCEMEDDIEREVISLTAMITIAYG